ncbi:efflux RND transporter periplasmic adaptor subunit [Pseudokordiimonas caeni]|uniref:efflux RND transporter periplasmic adaptor subunit n=1 Tax=Pseudokordiimonas caeni TaxID=2997908 RepID=UPI0028125FE3|nr:efflux RND transporter periplasmic adaptor subunit [Pseudokordiimonas caeni]
MRTFRIPLIVGLMHALVPTAAMAQNGPPPALVEVAPATEERMAPVITVPGTVVSLGDSRIAAEISGRVTWVAPEGTLVKRGDEVARIDDRNLSLTLGRNEAQVKRLEARLGYLKLDLARLQELATTNHTPTSRVEEATSNLAMVEQELAEARIVRDQTKVDLDRTRVRAPFPGRVVTRLAQIGEYATPGREIVRLVDTEHLEVTAQAPVSLSHVLEDGLAVTLRNGEQLVATSLRAIVPVGNTASRTMEVRAVVPADAGFVVGSPVQIALPSSTPERVVAVPRDALVLRSDATYIYRINGENKAEQILVETGAADGARIALKGDDVTAGDRIVVRGGERLRPGQDVQVKADLAELY